MKNKKLLDAFRNVTLGEVLKPIKKNLCRVEADTSDVIMRLDPCVEKPVLKEHNGWHDFKFKIYWKDKVLSLWDKEEAYTCSFDEKVIISGDVLILKTTGYGLHHEAKLKIKFFVGGGPRAEPHQFN
jgi:hypothetical protein